MSAVAPVPMNPNPRLLVIDDDPAIRQVVAGIGRSVGFDVSACEGDATLDEYLDAEADLIILDLVMPIVDGIEVIERLAKCQSAARLVLVSGQDRRVLASASRLATAHGLKVAATFAKPFSVADLRSCLDEQKGVISNGVTARLRRIPPAIRAARIEQALRTHEIVVHYQPQVSVQTLEWLGVEALVRWEHPEFGLLPPDTFVPVVERNRDLMQRFTQYIIRTAVHEMVPAEAVGGFAGRLAINVAADVLAAAEFPNQLVAILAEVGIGHERVVLEVTETTLPTEPVKALAIHTRLRMRGVSLAVDDFGTGHSSLERLHRFPMDELKIDLNFVRDSTSDPEARAIVHNSIALARDLRVRCVAEGVENVEALRLLSSLRCGYAQGYFIARPMPAGELGRWAGQWRQRRVDVLPQLG
ncbi:MAG TPA: EAL domain-containing response regulator [Steroidobacteraceae bacterium]|nr:EAL domain-containing response regulator [Steroidobacteraceae bacterium]